MATKKKLKWNGFSLIQRDAEERKCFICNSRQNVEIHHIFGGSNRDNSTEYGCVCFLCKHHHTGDINGSSDAVHQNRDFDLMLKRLTEDLWCERYGNKDDFIRIFGKWW